MLWKLTAVLAFSLAWLPASAVRADGDTPECCNYNGFYIGVGGGFAIEDFDKGGADNSAVANLRVGYRFLDFLAIEGLGEFEPHFNGKSGNYLSADVQIWSGWLNAKVYPVARWTGCVPAVHPRGRRLHVGRHRGRLQRPTTTTTGFRGASALGSISSSPSTSS